MMMSFRVALATRNLLFVECFSGTWPICEFYSLTPNPRPSPPPRRIIFDNQSNFLLAPPAFDLGLTGDCVTDRFKRLKPDKPTDFVFLSETSTFASLVTQHSRHKASGHTDIQHTALARRYVNEVTAFARHHHVCTVFSF